MLLENRSSDAAIAASREEVVSLCVVVVMEMLFILGWFYIVVAVLKGCPVGIYLLSKVMAFGAWLCSLQI